MIKYDSSLSKIKNHEKKDVCWGTQQTSFPLNKHPFPQQTLFLLNKYVKLSYKMIFLFYEKVEKWNRTKRWMI